MNNSLVKNYYKNKKNFPSGIIYDSRMNDDAKIFAKNLKLLMEYHKDTQTALANRCPDMEQKTVSNMLNPGDDYAPNLAKMGQVAKAYNLQTWHMLLPDLTIEILINSSIEKFVDNYIHADKETREAWASVAEATAKYIQKRKSG
jgi:acylphosphatase